MTSIDVRSPVDGSVYATRRLAGPDEIDRALGAARVAQAGWEATPVGERAEVCRRMVDRMLTRTGAIAEELAHQMGRPVAHGPGELEGGFQERARHMAGIAADALADVEVESGPGARRFIRRRPRGTVLVLAPWNFPFLCSVNTVVPALLAGNAVVLKMASQTPLVAERYAEAFAEAGLPDGVLQVLHLAHDDVARVIADDRVGFVAFTGSVAGGRAVEAAAAGRFIGTGLELGGKDPAYVRGDADLDRTVPALVDGAMFNAGQSCCAIERIYVERSVFGPFVEAFVDLVREYRLGDPLDPATTLGPLVRAGAADAVRAQVAEAVDRGARALVDEAGFAASRPGTPYLAPQVLVDVDHSMAVMTEETFGPVAGIMPVDGDDEAVALMNDSPFGLTASVWTSDLDVATAMGDRVETGTWFMNRCDYVDPALAWTGVKDSGRGSSLSRLGLEALTRPRSYHLRR